MTSLILGCGFVGKAYLKQSPQADFTRRSLFSLQDKSSWQNVLAFGKKTKVLWTFPAAQSLEDIPLAIEFYKTVLETSQVVVLGTTSSYCVREKGEIIVESTLLKKNNFRALAESALLKLGATVLRLSGIFGEERQPLKWYKKGLVKNYGNFLNLIHLKDILIAIDAIFSKDIRHDVFNLSNGDFKTHEDIVKTLVTRGELTADFLKNQPITMTSDNKRVSNEKSLKFLYEGHHNFVKYPPM